MKSSIRTGLVAALAAGAVATAVVPASAAVTSGASHAVAGAHAVAANPKTIKPAAYNQARSILANAGSQTAAKSHVIHGKDDVPVGYGTSLLAAARDEFRAADKKLPAKDKKSDMSIAHYNAIHSAANTMGITTW
ncbi:MULTISPECIES: hypothetical protein [Streptomyces]|uniref:hypothetical protein n=1 Tax=Streptomyces TaxID=1883 RepID=UPI0019AD01C3|nr:MULTISPECIES: hypothetical protein [Streptomyces]MCC2279888.1 hypothetical protein [Streptomyces sp. ET3-23]GHF46629.1 hypothetical protein GCM10010359_56400 [Streptomyces morookaense]